MACAMHLGFTPFSPRPKIAILAIACMPSPALIACAGTPVPPHRRPPCPFGVAVFDVIVDQPEAVHHLDGNGVTQGRTVVPTRSMGRRQGKSSMQSRRRPQRRGFSLFPTPIQAGKTSCRRAAGSSIQRIPAARRSVHLRPDRAVLRILHRPLSVASHPVTKS